MGNSVGYFCGWIYHSIIIAFVLVFFPEIIRKIILAVVWGLSIAGYIQVMFLNKGIDQIGVTAEGYIPDADRVIKNAVFGELQLQLHLSSHLFAKEME